MRKKKFKMSLINREYIVVYILLVSIAVLLMNYYYIPTTGFESSSNSGEVTLTISQPVCGDGICGYGESTSCCTDCGCPDGYRCFNNQCTPIKRGDIAPKFNITPENVSIVLEKGDVEVMDYAIWNPNTIRIRVKLGVADNGKLLSVNETELIVEPRTYSNFTVIASSLSTDPGNYSTRVVGISGVRTVNSYLEIEVVEQGEPYKIKPIFVKAQFDLVWLIVPLSIALLIYIFAIRYKYFH